MYKGIRIVYDSVIEDRILKILKSENIEKYIKFPKLEGVWGKELRHLNSHIWPGTDGIIFLMLPEEKSVTVLDKFRNFKKKLEIDVPFMIVVSPIEEII
ncbi:PG0541 family transporter-associated protein [Haliovirga abyssi]|uniref:DUF190 domain-containing protein n=1 Tax=Haliovirga abyssi TaxID=2996794 RepID=A0AAU9DFS9_9FUSO|nr:PG0541 family transporter-associated protein [Haliovirga abyssi]BDU49514.1 hypothetical protein HLVA_00830 [Haliovirga abyssi]